MSAAPLACGQLRWSVTCSSQARPKPTGFTGPRWGWTSDCWSGPGPRPHTLNPIALWAGGTPRPCTHRPCPRPQPARYGVIICDECHKLKNKDAVRVSAPPTYTLPPAPAPAPAPGPRPPAPACFVAPCCMPLCRVLLQRPRAAQGAGPGLTGAGGMHFDEARAREAPHMCARPRPRGPRPAGEHAPSGSSAHEGAALLRGPRAPMESLSRIRGTPNPEPHPGGPPLAPLLTGEP